MNEVCALCGSSVVYQRLDVTWPGSPDPQYLTIPAHCSNWHCPHATVRHQPLVWTTGTGPWKASGRDDDGIVDAPIR